MLGFTQMMVRGLAMRLQRELYPSMLAILMYSTIDNENISVRTLVFPQIAHRLERQLGDEWSLWMSPVPAFAADVPQSPLKVPSPGDELLQKGRAAYEKLQNDVRQGDSGGPGCWNQVKQQLRLLQIQTHDEACSSMGEVHRELIALTRIKCIYERSHRRFPRASDGCYLLDSEVPASWIKEAKEAEGFRYGAGITDNAERADLNVNPCLRYEELLRDLETMRGIESRRHLSDIRDDSDASEPNPVPNDIDGRDHVRTLEWMRREKIVVMRQCVHLTQKQVTECQRPENMDFGTFALVREQINHIDNICYFMHSLEWQRRNEMTVQRLVTASTATAAHLQQHLSQLRQMEELQVQQLKGGSQLQQLLQHVNEGIEESFTLLEQLRSFHRRLGIWFGGIEAYLIYVVSGCAVILFTMSRRVAAARAWIWFIMIIAAALEMCVHNSRWVSGMLFRTEKTFQELSEPSISLLISLIRWTSLVTSVLIWMHFLIRYRRPEQAICMELEVLQREVAKLSDKVLHAEMARAPREELRERQFYHQLQQQQQIQSILTKVHDLQMIRCGRVDTSTQCDNGDRNSETDISGFITPKSDSFGYTTATDEIIGSKPQIPRQKNLPGEAKDGYKDFDRSERKSAGIADVRKRIQTAREPPLSDFPQAMRLASQMLSRDPGEEIDPTYQPRSKKPGRNRYTTKGAGTDEKGTTKTKPQVVQPTRVQPPRRCRRNINYRKVVDTQHPDLFAAQHIRCDALSTEESSGDNSETCSQAATSVCRPGSPAT